MRKKITLLFSAIMLMTFFITPLRVNGQNRDDVVAYTLDGTIIGGTSGYATESEITQSDITWMVMGNTTMNPWRIGGKSLTEEDRTVYSTNVISDNITKIVVTHGTAANITINSMTLTVSSNADFSNPTSTLSGDFAASSSTTFERPADTDWSNMYFKITYNVTVSGSSNKFLQFISAEFYKASGSAESVATPTFSPAAGTYFETQNVAISCATESATIYYTLDGTNPTTESTVYTTPIAVSETTTVKAMAAKEGLNDSNIASATYTIQQLTSITTIAGLWEFAESVGTTATSASVTFNDWYVVGVRNNQVCVTDGQYGFVIYQSGHGFMAGDKLNGTVVCNVLKYQNHYAEITGVTSSALNVISGQEVPELTTSINSLEVRNYGTVINLGTLTYDGTSFADESGNTITPYNNFNITMPTLENGKQYNVKGAYIIYFSSSEIQQIAPRTADDFEEVTTITYTVNIADGIQNGTISADPTTAEEGTMITVTATPSEGYELTALSYSYGEVTTNIIETMQFVMPAADVTINATFNEIQTVAMPTFLPGGGTFITAQEVTISCATEDATIYYTIDGTEPTTESTVYAEPLTISETTTVKAFAVKEGMQNSAVATAAYTITEPVTIAAARALENNQYALVQGIVTFIDGRNIYVQDETAGIDLYLNTNTVPETLATGDMVLAYGKKTVYNNLVELTSINGGNANQFVIISSGNELPLAVKTIAEILADYSSTNMLQSTRVQIVDATIGAINTSNNTPITQDGSTLNIYKMPVVEGLEEGDFVTVTGIIGCYNNPQLRINSASDVEYTHPAFPTITAQPEALSGFNYVYEEGPSAVKTFVLGGSNLTEVTYVYPSENYEISSFPGDNFVAESRITITTYTGSFNYNIKVRLKEGLETGAYNESLMICQAEVDTLYVALSGSVTEQGQSTDYTRISDLSQLSDGSKVIFAARFDENASSYYAMSAQASGKPTGVLFTSIAGSNETLPSEITDEESTYFWTIAIDGDNYTFTNADGSTLGYSSSTNFATGGDNTGWTIEQGVSDTASMVPSYGAFVITNANITGRAIALNTSHNFGPYAKSNMTGNNAASYNFLIDIFATAGSGVMTCATPTFEPEGGTYYEAQNVVISCNTADATIYYTTDGSEPTVSSTIYSAPVAVSESMTIKAIAMKEGYENSNIATAQYNIIIGAVTIFSQDWEGEMNGWTFVSVEGNKPWTIATYSGNHYAYGNGYNGGVNEQWCVSPAFSLDSYEGVTLTFRNAKNYTGPDMQLFFSNDYAGDPTAATWTELEFEKSAGSFAWTESGDIELNNFAGSNCHIGFKYTSTETEAAAWEIDDITLIGFTTEPYLTATPSALSGFTHIVNAGPSAVQTFHLTGGNLPSFQPSSTYATMVNLSVNEPFEISSDNESFGTTAEIYLSGYSVDTTIYVRLNGAEAGQYNGSITISDIEDLEISVALSGNVVEQGNNWNRIYSLSDLTDGSQVIIASRYDATIGNGYYAMPAVVSGKPDGTLFTSEINGGTEILPAEIATDADTYLWNVTVDGEVVTFVNMDGDTLGYAGSSTNFQGNQYTSWNIAFATSEDGAMIPNYSGFVFTNIDFETRGIAKNTSNKFGAYSTTNLNSSDYNFYLDLFVQGGIVTPTVATPVISMASGTYYEEFDVEITCATEGATIFYTTDGNEPTIASNVYTNAIHVDGDMTLKAFAVAEGYENSSIATANYVFISGNVILSQDWEGEMNGWTFVTVEGNKPWTVATYAGNKYANANGYSDDVDNEQWCISPAFDLAAYAGSNVTLTFMNATKFNGPALELYFSNDYDGQDPTAASWQPLSYIPSEGNYEWTESGNISLSAFSGNSCYIAFRYISTVEDGAAAWEIDDILVVADMSEDPYLAVTPNALSGFEHVIGEGPSEAQTFIVTGGNLLGIVELEVNSSYEISLDGEDYSNILTIDTDSTLEPTTVYVRLNGEAIGSYEGMITVTSAEAETVTVALSGEVTEGIGVEETLASSVSIWNNHNELMIENNSNNELHVMVFNIMGQPMINCTVATGSSVIRHNLVDGAYIVRISNSNEVSSMKTVVRK